MKKEKSRRRAPRNPASRRRSRRRWSRARSTSSSLRSRSWASLSSRTTSKPSRRCWPRKRRKSTATLFWWSAKASQKKKISTKKNILAPKYKRILLKLSGEALMGEDAFGINRNTIERIVGEIAQVAALGLEIAVVIGGGNIFRGVAPGAAGMDRATADYIGMLATIMNALALQDAMRQAGLN